MPSGALADAVAAGGAAKASTDVEPKKYSGIIELVSDDAQWSNLAAALPPAMVADDGGGRFRRMVVTALKKNPDLIKLGSTQGGRNSIIQALMRCAELGLEPNTDLGHAYLIPFQTGRGQDRHLELQFIIGYKGILKLAAESGNLKTIDVREVYENDHFEVEYGTGPNAGIVHRPALTGDRGEVYCYYGVVRFHDGGFYFLHMTRADIEARRQRSATGSRDKGPWKTDYDAMARKTVVRAMAPYMRLAAVQAEAIEHDERTVGEDGTFTYIETTADKHDKGDDDDEPADEGDEGGSGE